MEKLKETITQAVILVGGLGTRLRPLTDEIPKPMVPVEGKPFLLLQLNYLKAHGINEFVFCVGYKKDVIIDYFEDGKKFGVHIDYSREEELLGTGGALKNAESLLTEEFVVMNGDTYVEVDIHKFYQQYQLCNKKIGIALVSAADPSRYGVVTIENNIIRSFAEKSDVQTGPGLINAGLYIMKKEVIGDSPEQFPFSLEKEVFPRYAGEISAYISRDYFIDIGTIDSYSSFCKSVSKIKYL